MLPSTHSSVLFLSAALSSPSIHNIPRQCQMPPCCLTPSHHYPSSLTHVLSPPTLFLEASLHCQHQMVPLRGVQRKPVSLLQPGCILRDLFHPPPSFRVPRCSTPPLHLISIPPFGSVDSVLDSLLLPEKVIKW